MKPEDIDQILTSAQKKQIKKQLDEWVSIELDDQINRMAVTIAKRKLKNLEEQIEQEVGKHLDSLVKRAIKTSIRRTIESL